MSPPSCLPWHSSCLPNHFCPSICFPVSRLWATVTHESGILTPSTEPQDGQSRGLLNVRASGRQSCLHSARTRGHASERTVKCSFSSLCSVALSERGCSEGASRGPEVSHSLLYPLEYSISHGDTVPSPVCFTLISCPEDAAGSQPAENHLALALGHFFGKHI